ncbi:MAG: hypothetical protein IJN53_00500 [Oscillospiraceae bacterium]|nr:hypothetical protein [Oscillospiraceae bacterium]
MNFEERKAEIFRRGNARIAAKKRKKRIILGAVVPVLLVALLAFPVGRLLSSAKGEEKAPAILMENQPSIAPGEQPAPQATYPELVLNDNTQPFSPGVPPGSSMGRFTIGRDPRGNWNLGFFYQTPPDLWLYSLEGDVVKAQEVGYNWTNKILFWENSTVSESPDILSPGVVDVQIHTSYGYLVLDASNYMPWDVDAEYWSASVLGKESFFDGNGQSAFLAFDENQWLPASTDFFPSQKLYRLNLRPGDNIYHISIQWPKGGASYCFRVNYEE